MRLGMSQSLAPFKKHYTCGHKFGCLESLLRKAAKTVAVWLFTKGALSLVFGFDIQREAISLLSDNWEVAQGWSKDESDLAFWGLEFFLISTLTLYRTSCCWRKFLLAHESVE